MGRWSGMKFMIARAALFRSHQVTFFLYMHGSTLQRSKRFLRIASVVALSHDANFRAFEAVLALYSNCISAPFEWFCDS